MIYDIYKKGRNNCTLRKLQSMTFIWNKRNYNHIITCISSMYLGFLVTKTVILRR